MPISTRKVAAFLKITSNYKLMQKRKGGKYFENVSCKEDWERFINELSHANIKSDYTI